ncbi:undecaprenyl-diphosphatase [Isoptericola sp. CG 20/1183]|uniref:Undecaprenyl-diphosphatase n=1 Tax=Isoptericola halotolerans TaxID=300560 RepID=A0ABX5EHA1_9MICO|nr:MULTISPECIES: phosphatase PAP2 family protein [Isoptericola]PRZ02869.1 undecaprenyl-diphosphatase [Isoptericola sp. CG 20/1183]PRZ09866.1 undecaprenyl-diphosphatase [Isoptericola halotolerans]
MPRSSDRTRALVRAGAFGLAGFLPVLVLAWLVRAEAPAVLDADQAAVAAALEATRDLPALQTGLVVWQEVTQPRWVVLAGGLLCLWVWRRRGLGGRALWAFGTLVASWGLSVLAKEAVGRLRPQVDDAITAAPGFSFPSGHAMAAATGAVTLTLLVWPLLGPRARVAVPAVAATLALVTAAHRVMLGVHFPSDVVAGALLGATFAGASYLGYVGWTSTARIPEPEVR